LSSQGTGVLELSIIMPCLNEAETLEVCIRKSQDFLQDHQVEGEVIIADNGSTDGSDRIARRMGARVVRVEEKGYGSALMGGITAAAGRYIIMGDADDSYDFTSLAPFLERLRAGDDLVMGNRFKGGIEPGAMPLLHRYLGNPVLTRIGRLFFWRPCGDFHCGLRGFSKTAIESLDLRTTGMEFASEMVVKAAVRGMRISEVPTILFPDGRSRPPHLRSWRDGWRHLRFLLIFSPRWLFFYPGVFMMLLGLAVGAWLLPGPRRIGSVVLDVNTLLYAALAILIGFQSAAFATFAKLFAISEGLLPEDPRLTKIFKHVTLEVGLVIGTVLMGLGLAGSLGALGMWRYRAFGNLDPTHTLRLIVPAIRSYFQAFSSVCCGWAAAEIPCLAPLRARRSRRRPRVHCMTDSGRSLMETIHPPPRSRVSLWLAALLIFAFVLRLGAVALITGLHTPPAVGTDECEYDSYAWNLAQGNGYRGPSPNVSDENHLTAYRPPAPSIFVAGLYVLFGHTHVVAYVADILLAVLTVWLIFQITLRCFNQRAAWLAALCYVVYPISLYYGLTLTSEIFSTFLVSLFAWCCLGIKDAKGMRWAIGAGLALGLILLSKPGFVFLLPLLPFLAWIVCGKRKELWLRALVIPVLAALLLTPWIVRNRIVMHAFIPFSTGGGSLLLQANNRQVIEDPAYYGYAVFDYCLPEYAVPIRTANDELKRDAIAKKFAVQWIGANHDKWFYLVRSKFLRLWTVDYTGNRFHSLAWILFLTYGIMLTAFALTVFPFTRRLLRERHPGLIMIAMILATVATALVFHGQHRYRFPIDGFCISIAAGGVFWLRDTLRGQSREARYAAVRNFFRIHRLQVVGACVLVLGLSLWCRADNRYIEGWRNDVCEQRLKAIGLATARYRQVHGELPSRLSLLVPEFLPNVEALHCPKHTISYNDHTWLPMTDAEPYQRLISYSLITANAPGGEAYIVESIPHHGEDRNGVTLSGELFRVPPAPLPPTGIVAK
jgi:4-amino-4-deoxy-L-arabinose transferase-like glycosyltransferase/glycosyltransferase involved in cell wall biosynthesis